MWTCPHCDGQTDDEYQICWTCRIPRGSPADYHENDRVLITTTSSLESYNIVEYKGPVFGEMVYGANFFRDFAAGFSDMFGGRSGSYESVLKQGRAAAMSELADRAEKIGCNAVVGLRVQYEPVGTSMFFICVSGTAVRVVPRVQEEGIEPT